jgi:hypothetical protein
LAAVLDSKALPVAAEVVEAVEQGLLVVLVRRGLTVVLEATLPYRVQRKATHLVVVAHREGMQVRPLKMASVLNMVAVGAAVKAPVETHMGKVAVRFMEQEAVRLVATTAAELLAQVVLGVRIPQAAEERLVQGELAQAQEVLVIRGSLVVVMVAAAEAIRQAQVGALEQ